MSSEKLEECLGVPTERPEFRALEETSVSDVDPPAEHTEEEAIESLVDLIVSMEATSPDVVRGIRIHKLLRHAPWYWWQGQLREMHQFSERVQQIDEFWSHSWRLASWTKYLNALFLNNAWPACVVSLVCSGIAFALFLMGVLPEWTLGPFRCSWCSFSGMAAYFLTLFLCRRRVRAFVDIACINQKEPVKKLQGLISLGAILKKSKRLLVLYDSTFTTRLWCLFELGGYLYSRGTPGPASTEPEIRICPPLLGPMLLGVQALLVLSLLLLHMGKLLLQYQLVLLPCLALIATPLAHGMRAYWRGIDAMQQQVARFSFAKASCDCCTKGHPGGRACDRVILAKSITAWFGSIEAFEANVQTEVRMALVRQLTNEAFTYDRLVQAAVPLLWMQLDVSASHSGDWTVWTRWVELSRAATHVFAICPSWLKLLCFVTLKLRAQNCRLPMEIVMSLVIVVLGSAIYLGCSTLEEYLVWFLIPTQPYGPVFGSVISVSTFSVIALVAWRCLPEFR